jgi:hypothetical protein
MPRTATALITLVVLTFCARAQEPTGDQEPQQQRLFRTGTEALLLDVMVLDQDRRPVKGLGAVDFLVRIDGKPARIIDATEVGVPTVASGAAPVWDREAASDVATNGRSARRLFVIVIDDARTGLNRTLVTGAGMRQAGTFRDPWIGEAGRKIARDVVDGLGPYDLAAVAFSYLGRGQNFTSDRTKLIRAIETYIPQGGSAAGFPLGCAFKGPSGCTLGTLDSVLDGLAAAPAMRKVIVFISQGEGMAGLSGDEWLSSQASGGQGLFAAPLAIAQRVVRRLQESNTVVYAFSPGGLQIVGDPHLDGLRGLAEATGGRAVVNTNAPWADVQAVMNETAGYYLLGVELPAADGRFHRTDVSVNVPGAEVRTRRGYVAQPRAVDLGRTATATSAPTVRALALPAGDLPLLGHVLPRFAPGSREAHVRLSVGVRTTGVERHWPLELVATAYDHGNYRQRARTEQRAEITSGQQTWAETELEMRLPPGRYELRVAGSASGSSGSVLLEVEFPDYRNVPLWLSPLALSLSNGPVATTPLTVRRTFAAGQRPRLVAQIVRGGRRDAVSTMVTTTIVNETGTQVATVVTPIEPSGFAKTGMIDLDTPVNLEGLTAGEYLLTVVVAAGERRATSLLRFRME